MFGRETFWHEAFGREMFGRERDEREKTHEGRFTHGLPEKLGRSKARYRLLSFVLFEKNPQKRKVQNYLFRGHAVMFLHVTLNLLAGFVTTLKIFALTLLFALPLGLLISFGSMSRVKVLKYPIRAFIWIIRGTPLMLQLIIIFYGPGLIGTWATHLLAGGTLNPGTFGYNLVAWLSSWTVVNRFIAVITGFVINYACYFSEIFRGGIEAIPKGQYEACQVLGLTKSQTFFKVILMQVVKHIIPPMSNEIITLVKDTSLARVIMVYEIIWNGQRFINSNGILWPLFYTGAFYLAFCGLLTLLFSYIEKKLSYYRV